MSDNDEEVERSAALEALFLQVIKDVSARATDEDRRALAEAQAKAEAGDLIEGFALFRFFLAAIKRTAAELDSTDADVQEFLEGMCDVEELYLPKLN
jgi:hypothetical protein